MYLRRTPPKDFFWIYPHNARHGSLVRFRGESSRCSTSNEVECTRAESPTSIKFAAVDAITRRFDTHRLAQMPRKAVDAGQTIYRINLATPRLSSPRDLRLHTRKTLRPDD